MSRADWEVGQDAVIVTRDRQQAFTIETATISKVGRKWVTIGEGWREHRFDFDGRSEQTWGHAPSLWASEAAFRDEQERRSAWTSLTSLARANYPPDHLTTDQIAALITQIKGDA